MGLFLVNALNTYFIRLSTWLFISLQPAFIHRLVVHLGSIFHLYWTNCWWHFRYYVLCRCLWQDFVWIMLVINLHLQVLDFQQHKGTYALGGVT